MKTDLDSLASFAKGLISPEWVNGPHYSMLQFARFDNACSQLKLNIVGKRCLDLGCGPNKPYSNAVILYLLGASRVVAVDVDDITNHKMVAGQTYALLLSIAADQTMLTSGSTERRRLVYDRLAGFNLRALAEGDLRAGLPPEIKHAVGDYRELDPDLRQFDVCVSFSVFEHIGEIRSIVEHLYANCSNHGFVFSDIDYRDHRLYSAKASPWQYLIDDGDYSPGYINKIRNSKMLEILKDSGFEVSVTECVKSPVPPEIRSNILLANRHWSQEDLETVQAQVVLKKDRRWWSIL